MINLNWERIFSQCLHLKKMGVNGRQFYTQDLINSNGERIFSQLSTLKKDTKSVQRKFFKTYTDWWFYFPVNRIIEYLSVTL